MNISVVFFGSYLGASELLFVVLLLFGAKRLPAVARMMVKSMEELRRAAQQFTHDITDGNDPGNSAPGPDKSGQLMQLVREREKGLSTLVSLCLP